MHGTACVRVYVCECACVPDLTERGHCIEWHAGVWCDSTQEGIYYCLWGAL